MDASTYDEICVNCGATDEVPGGWGRLASPCSLPGWLPIATAPTDGTLVQVYAAPREGLPAFVTDCAYHPDAGWCVDELREVTHWKPKT